MSKCKACNREMLGQVSCTVPTLVVNGKVLARIRYGDEPDSEATAPCHDCATPVGGIHHARCDVERCPDCGRQRIGCGCERADVGDGNATTDKSDLQLWAGHNVPHSLAGSVATAIGASYVDHRRPDTYMPAPHMIEVGTRRPDDADGATHILAISAFSPWGDLAARIQKALSPQTEKPDGGV